ncbi:MAG TPA: cupin domain-containing protein [Chloroflexota bacterium]|nr:cupin domain-containing protein [Chloroflexota bacterium]
MPAEYVFPLAEILETTNAQGAVWSHEGRDLDVNLVFFRGVEGVETHVNDEVDVLGVVLEGEGVLTVDGTETRIHGGEAFYIPRGARRSIRAAGWQVAYLSCHPRRRGLRPA